MTSFCLHIDEYAAEPKVSGGKYSRTTGESSCYCTLKLKHDGGEITIFVDPTKGAWLDSLIARAATMRAELAELEAAEAKRFQELVS